MISPINTKIVNDNYFTSKRPDFFSVLTTLYRSSSDKLSRLAHVEGESHDEMIDNDREEAKLLSLQREILAKAGEGYIDSISQAIEVLDLWHLETRYISDGNQLNDQLVLNVRDFLKKQQKALSL